MTEDNKAASSVVGVVIMIALAIIVANILGVLFFDVGEATNTPPQVGGQMDKVISHETYDSCIGADCPGASDTQTFTLYHVAGERVDTQDLRIKVDVRKAGSAYIDRILEDGVTAVEDPAGAESDDAHALGNNPNYFDYGEFGDTYIGDHWSATKPIRFRLKFGGIELDQGDEVNVKVIHKPSDTVIYDEDVSAN